MKKEKIISVGGQAVIEGVMMKSPEGIATAVRRPNGEIVYRKKTLGKSNAKLMKIPFVRGVVILLESLFVGTGELTFAANQSGEEEEELTKGQLIGTLALSLLLGMGLFMILPSLVAGFIFHNSLGMANVLEGILRVVIFLSYIYFISLNKDIKRVFQYHGAEHKTVHNYESGEELSVENARKFSTIHPRCGTNFLMIFLLVAILVHSLFGLFGALNMAQRILVRLIALPIVAGISYELLRLFDKYPRLRVLAAPGMLLQRLTTAQPDDSQLEVAIVSLKHALGMEDEAELVNKDDSAYSEVDKPVEFLG